MASRILVSDYLIELLFILAAFFGHVFVSGISTVIALLFVGVVESLLFILLICVVVGFASLLSNHGDLLMLLAFNFSEVVDWTLLQIAL